MNRFRVPQPQGDLVFISEDDQLKLFRCPNCQTAIMGVDMAAFNRSPNVGAVKFGYMLVYEHAGLPWPDGAVLCANCGWRAPSRDLVVAETLVPEARDVGDDRGPS